MVRIGEDRTERLDIVPAQLRVIVTVRPKYACRGCEPGVTEASAPAHLIKGVMPSEGALAHVLVSRYADPLPRYRPSQMRARSGLDVHRSTLAGWVGKTAFHLRPLTECLAMDTNFVENRIRTVKLTAKNALLAGHDVAEPAGRGVETGEAEQR